MPPTLSERLKEVPSLAERSSQSFLAEAMTHKTCRQRQSHRACNTPRYFIIQDSKQRTLALFDGKASYLGDHRLMLHGVCKPHLLDHRGTKGIAIPCSEPQRQLQTQIFRLRVIMLRTFRISMTGAYDDLGF